tara:strand:+ start:1413 stop:2324 length:912 start_codon:yes stop_codon:yes gene_type:complete
MGYRNIVSSIWLMQSNEYNTKLNKTIRKAFPDSSDIHNSLSRTLPYVEFNINRVLSDVYKDIYRIEKEFEHAVNFKERFNKIKLENKIGIAQMEYIDEKGKEIDEEIILFKGYYSCYLVILQHFFFCYFLDEIRLDVNLKIKSLNTFLQDEKKALADMPYNYFIQYGFYKIRDLFTVTDIKEYVTIVTDLIDELKEKSIVEFKSLNDLKADSLFLNSQASNFFSFLIEKNSNNKNDAFFSKLHRYFKSRNYWKDDKPKSYFEFLEEGKIYNYKSRKLQTPTTTNEEDVFEKFDKLLFTFLFNQ